MQYPEPPEPPSSPGNDQDDKRPDVRQPPAVPPDKAPDVIPRRDPPKPGRSKPEPPMIA